MSEVTLKHVVKAYGTNEVIHGIDLEVHSGEFVVFVGPSGCGKSTLLRMIAGLEDITGGQIVIGWLDGLVGRLPGRPSLYQALRRPPARKTPQSARPRALAIAAAVLLLPVAWVAAAIEVAMRRGGTVYVEGRRV